MLTPKVKQNLILWLIENAEKYKIDTLFPVLDYVRSLHISAQFGIFQDYFWEVHKVYISTYLNETGSRFIPEVSYMTEDGLYICRKVRKITSETARETAIQKASEIVEQRL